MQELRLRVLALRAFNLETLLIGEHVKSKEPLVTQIRYEAGSLIAFECSTVFVYPPSTSASSTSSIMGPPSTVESLPGLLSATGISCM
jgi:hypothetical protein